MCPQYDLTVQKSNVEKWSGMLPWSVFLMRSIYDFAHFLVLGTFIYSK